MKHVARKKLTEAKLKEVFRIKLFEFCKTRTKKSSPDLFRFYLISAGDDIAIDSVRATTCRRNFRAPWLQTERTKMKGLLKEWVLTGKQFEDFRQKIQKFHSSHGEQNKGTTRPQGQKLNMNHVARKELTEAKLKKAFRKKLFELWKTRTKESSPDLFVFYATSLGQDVARDNGRATTCRRDFNASWS